MQIPRFWAYGINPFNKNLIWRNSDISVEQAQKKVDSIIEILLQMKSGQLSEAEYSSDEYPIDFCLHEKLIEEYTDYQGFTTAILTRNSIGSLVLNFSNLLVLDWDLDQQPYGFNWLGLLATKVKRFFCRLFGRPQYEPKTRKQTVREKYSDLYDSLLEGTSKRCLKLQEKLFSILNPLLLFVEEHSDWSVRLYRTARGLRGIVTHLPFEPDEATMDLMNTFFCDPNYIRFCRFQRCFRARISPKGYRCGFRLNKVAKCFRFRYPWIPGDTQSAELYEKGVKLYEEKTRRYATCRFLTTIGSGVIHSKLQNLIQLHDTAALTSLEFKESIQKPSLSNGPDTSPGENRNGLNNTQFESLKNDNTQFGSNNTESGNSQFGSDRQKTDSKVTNNANNDNINQAAKENDLVKFDVFPLA